MCILRTCVFLSNLRWNVEQFFSLLFYFILFVYLFVCSFVLFHLIPFFLSIYLFITDSNARQREDKTCGDTNGETKSRRYRNKGSEKGKCIHIKIEKTTYSMYAHKKHIRQTSLLLAYTDTQTLCVCARHRFFTNASEYFSLVHFYSLFVIIHTYRDTHTSIHPNTNIFILTLSVYYRDVFPSPFPQQNKENIIHHPTIHSQIGQNFLKSAKKIVKIQNISYIIVFLLLCNLFLLVLFTIPFCSCLNFNLSIVCLLWLFVFFSSSFSVFTFISVCFVISICCICSGLKNFLHFPQQNLLLSTSIEQPVCQSILNSWNAWWHNCIAGSFIQFSQLLLKDMNWKFKVNKERFKTIEMLLTLLLRK